MQNEKWSQLLKRVFTVVVHDRADPNNTLRDHKFLIGEYLEQVGRLPEPLRNRGWKVDAYFIPETTPLIR